MHNECHSPTYSLAPGFNVNLTCDTGTALHDASLGGKTEVAKYLLNMGIDVTIRDAMGLVRCVGYRSCIVGIS